MDQNCTIESPTAAEHPGCVLLVRNYVVPIVLAAGQLRFDIQQIIDSDSDWLWRGIQVSSASALSSVLVRLEVNDYFLSNVRVPLTFYAFSGWQSKVFERDIWVERGGRVAVEAENTSGSAFNGGLTLLGVKIREYAR